jgi:uncharacterized protein (TIGR03000 family)
LGGGCNGGGCHGGGGFLRGLHGRRSGHGCNGGGCAGGYGCAGGCAGGYGCAGGCAGTVVPKKDEKMPDPKKQKTAAPASVSVNLPADAKLTIDGTPTTSTSAQRMFVSPTLEAGQDYYYTFKATVVRDGRPVVAEQRVRVRAGETTPVSFDFSSTGVVLK